MMLNSRPSLPFAGSGSRLGRRWLTEHYFSIIFLCPLSDSIDSRFRHGRAAAPVPPMDSRKPLIQIANQGVV